MEKEVLLSTEGLKKIEQELEHLKSVRRREVAERIKQAREFGDISENSEYEDAKNEQAFIEGRILTIDKMLRNAKLIEEPKGGDPKTVTIGAHVKVRDLDENEVYDYTIVGSTEADPASNRISNESPVGKSLLGARVGQKLSIGIPAGTLRVEVLEVHR
ncbi:MAG: transcription elongation factor GreA [Thermaerobacter sp.]|nr:transcription elongation factor GreA [Thermaerobacter sp.]